MNAPRRAPAPPRVQLNMDMVPMALCHVAVFAALWTGVTAEALWLCLALYVIRMFGVTAGYHRYFGHRTYKMGRVAQFCMAFLAETSAQRGALWWAGHHRHHHRHSDDPQDIHSPVQRGFWYSHIGWIFAPGVEETPVHNIKDFARYPELRWLDRHWLVPPILLAIGCFWWMGWTGLVVGFFWSTVLLWHGTFTINSLSHVFGSRRFATTDDSRNNPLLALITLGEGWHNNHHRFPSSVRQGFYWYEFDISYMILKALSWICVVRDLRAPGARVLAEGRRNDEARRQGRPIPAFVPDLRARSVEAQPRS